jgi:hypothetical protein
MAALSLVAAGCNALFGIDDLADAEPGHAAVGAGPQARAPLAPSPCEAENGAAGWVRTLGGPGRDRGASLALSKAGCLALGGVFSNELELGGAIGLKATGEQGFFGWLDEAGEPIAAEAAAPRLHVRSVDVTPELDLVVAGHGGDLGDGGAVTRYGFDGVVRWSAAFDERTTDVALAGDGAVVTAGKLVEAELERTVVRKLEAVGTTAWTVNLPEGVEATVVDVAESFVLVGGKRSVAGSTGDQPFVALLDAESGAMSCELAFDAGACNVRRVRDADVHPEGGFVVVGDGKDGAGAQRRAFVARLDDACQLSWDVTLEGEDVHASAVVVGSSGEIIVAGHLDGGADKAHDKADAYIAVLGGDGALDRFDVHRTPGGQRPEALALAPGGALVLAGTFEGVVDLGVGELEAAGHEDIFVARLPR